MFHIYEIKEIVLLSTDIRHIFKYLSNVIIYINLLQVKQILYITSEIFSFVTLLKLICFIEMSVTK